MAEADSKVCRSCGNLLPAEAFYRNKTFADGLMRVCKTCHNQQCNERYHRTKVLRSTLTQCAHCGKEFHRPRPDANSVKFCSVDCRFWHKVDRSGGPDACWNWTSKSRAQGGAGYGNFNFDGKVRHAHRVAWELTNGPIPDGLHGCHKCDNVLCCNPAHLFIGTHDENMEDMRAKGRDHKITPEMVAAATKAKLGKPRSAEVRAKLSAAGMGKVPWNKGKKAPQIAAAKRASWAAKKSGKT